MDNSLPTILKNQSGFQPNTYPTRITTTTTVDSIDLTTSEGRAVMLTNTNVTAGNSIRIGFGLTEASAEINVLKGITIMPGQTVILQPPQGHWWMAHDADANTPILSYSVGY